MDRVQFKLGESTWAESVRDVVISYLIRSTRRAFVRGAEKLAKKLA
jgi:hypothetical protein